MIKLTRVNVTEARCTYLNFCQCLGGIMYNGDNPIALQSRECLCEALLNLLKVRKFNEITIKDICKKADLSRQTFYQIFKSKEEIIEYHFEKLFIIFRDSCSNFSNITIKELIKNFFTFFYEHRDFIEVLTENNMSYVVEREFEHYLPEIDLFHQASEDKEYKDYTISFLSGAFCQTLMHWYERNLDLSIDEISEIVEGIIIGKYIS